MGGDKLQRREGRKDTSSNAKKHISEETITACVNRLMTNRLARGMGDEVVQVQKVLAMHSTRRVRG